MERRSQPPTLIQFSETVSFHDQVGFAIQFMNVVVASALVVVGLAKFQFPTEDTGEALALDLKHLFSLYFFLVGVPLAVIFAVVAAITIKFNKWVIASFLGFTALASLAYLIICFVLGKWATGIFGALIVIVALAPFAIRFKSVQVVEAFVNHSFFVIKEDPRLAIPALAFGFISTFWSIMWSVFILMIHSSSYPHAVRVILILVLLASWILTTLFLRSYSHIMMSGIVSVWYFHDRKAPHGASSSLVWSAKRTIKLVGSAAMASVFSAIGALARFVFQLIPIQLHGNKYFRMASNFSLYYQNQSLADVMCHNHTFLQADVLVRHAIQEKIFEPIFELFFVERFMTCMALLAALIGGSLGGLSAHIFGWDYHVLSFIVVGAALGFTIVLACLEVFTVMSSTTFVCLAQDPGTIAPLKVPELVDNLKELFPAIRTL